MTKPDRKFATLHHIFHLQVLVINFVLYSCVGGLEYFDCDLKSDRFVMLLFSDNLTGRHQTNVSIYRTHYLLPLEMRFINEPNEGHIRVNVHVHTIQATYSQESLIFFIEKGLVGKFIYTLTG